MLLQLSSFLRCVQLPAFVFLVAAATGAAHAGSSSPANPRHTGSPFVHTWLAESYGAHPENFCVLQDPHSGFIYVGNRDGVLEFDGVRWRLIPTPEDVPARSLSVDAHGRIWGCGGSMIFRLEPDARGELQARPMLERLPAEFRSRRAIYQSVATAQGVYFRDLKNLILFRDGAELAEAWRVAEGAAVTLRLWAIDQEPYVTVGTPANVVLRRRGERFEPVPSLKSSVLAAHAESKGTWLLSTTQGIQTWNGTDILTVQRPSELEDVQQSTFLADGRIAFATLNRGLVLCDREGRYLQSIDRAKGLPANQVTGIATDREGGLWVTLPYGIARLQLDSPYARHGPAQGVEGTVRSLARRGDELFCGGTEGVARRGADGQFLRVRGIPGPTRELVAQEGWLFSLAGKLRGVPPESDSDGRDLENRNYYGLVTLAGAPGWYAHGSNEGLRWAHFSGDKWISKGPLKTLRGVPTALLEAPTGVVWAADSNQGAWRVDFRTGLRTDAPGRVFGSAEGLPREPTALFLLGGDVVALAAGQLLRFDDATGRFAPETRIAGLDNFLIQLVHHSSDGTIWLQGEPGSGREIRRVRPEAGADIDRVNQARRWRAKVVPGERLQHLLPTTLFHEAATQTLWIGGHGALISYDLTWQPTRRSDPPAAVVRRVETAFGRVLAVSASTSPPLHLETLDPDEDALRISFAAPAFTFDHAGVVHTQYRTRLDGLDRDWTAWSPQPERDFTHLPWRAFTFRVQARDDSGRVGPEATIAFSIRPAWWATRIAWAGYGVLGLCGLAGAVQWRTVALHRRAERLEQIVAERTRELATSNAELARLNRLELDQKIAAQLAEEKARLEVLRYQLNPHFLYNSLNSIYGLLFENARDAGEMVLRLSDFCRAALTGAKDELPTVEAEMAALRTYLDVEKVRWNRRLQIEFNVAPEVTRLRLPPFLLLPLVENAIKYGIRTSPHALRLSIRAFRDSREPSDHAPRSLVIEIANSGEWVPPGPPRPDSTGIGLENLRQRLQRYYPGAHTFTTEVAAGWVVARLRLERPLAPAVIPPDAGSRPPL